MNYVEACDCLGLSSDEALTNLDLKKAFKKAALIHHPDKNLQDPEQAKETFQHISQAYSFLSQCIARSQTGPNQPRFATADTYDNEDDDDDEDGYYYEDDDGEDYEDGDYQGYVDLEELLFARLFARMYGQGFGSAAAGSGGVRAHVVPGFGVVFEGASPYGYRSSHSTGNSRNYTPRQSNYTTSSSFQASNGYYNEDSDDDDDDDDDELDDYIERMAEQARRKEEARQEAKQRREEHAKYMAERARQAELEGREFFESWNIKQLKGECQRRGISIKNMQQKDIVQALITHEAKKRLREEIKQQAPLLDEWAEVIQMKHRPEMNGMKVRVIDFYDDKYTVEWDINAAKKKTKGYTRESRQARVKPEHLRLWGTGGESLPNDTTNNKKSKSNSKSKPSKAKSSSSSSDAASTTIAGTMSDKENKQKNQTNKTLSSKNKTKSSSSKLDKQEASTNDTTPPLKASESPESERKAKSTTKDSTDTQAKSSPKSDTKAAPVLDTTPLPPKDDESEESGRKAEPTREETTVGSSSLESGPARTAESTPKSPPTPATSHTKTKTPPEQHVLKTKFCAICHKEHDMEAHKNKINTEKSSDNNSSSSKNKAVVLPCGHIFCSDCCNGTHLPDPSSAVPVRSCRVCGKGDPGIDALKVLPYIKDLRDPSQDLLEAIYNEYSLIVTCESVKALEKQQQKELDQLKAEKNQVIKEKKEAINKSNSSKGGKDKKGKLMKQMLASAEDQFEPRRKALGQKHALSWRSVDNQGGLKDLQSKRNAAIGEVTKAINKHYRRASIKVHPDRHGEQFQQEFDDLTKARDTLSEIDLRHIYMEQMLEVVVKVGSAWVKGSHEAWVQKHQPDFAEQNPTTKKSDERHRQLLIEGGMMHRKPRRPGVAILNSNDRRIRVTLQIPGGSFYEFNSYCQAVHIMGERADVYNEEFDDEYTTVVLKDSFNNKHGEAIEVDITLPEHGLWNICWSFAMELELGAIDHSERSTSGTVDLVSPKYKAQMQLMKTFEDLAKRRGNKIKSAIRKLENQKLNNHADVKARYDTLQEAILKGKQTEYHLEKAMKSVGANMAAAHTPFTDLRSALSQAIPQKTQLDEAMATHEKRVGFKNFKNAVYDILETGDACVWAATVTSEMLKDMKGDSNRLYQLLMEGKKAYDLELVDAATLIVASDRKDIFTAKQLQALWERSEETELRAAEEAHGLMIDNQKREAAEKSRRALEERASLKIEFGALVQIQGLKSEPTLNGRLATYMGLGQGERFNLRLNEGREIALKKQNFCKWNGLGAPNFGPARSSKTTEGWSCHACTYRHEGRSADGLVSGSMCGTSRDGQANHDTQNVESTSDKHGKSRTRAPNLVATTPTTNADQSAKSTSRKSAEKNFRPTEQHNAASAPAGMKAHVHVATPATTTADVKPVETKKSARCRFGRKCNRIKKGTCKFQHSAEEIAFIMGKVPVVDPSPPVEFVPNHDDRDNTPADSFQKGNSHSVPGSHDTDNSVKTFEHTIMIEAKAAKLVVGKKGYTIKSICRRSGAKIVVQDKQFDTNGLCPVRIRGRTQTIIDSAASLVEAKANSYDPSYRPFGQDVVPSANSSVSTIPSIISRGENAISPMTTATTSTALASTPKTVDLKDFLDSHERSLKCSSGCFLEWLKKQDIVTIADLVDALEDEDFVSELVKNGLKRFRLMAFSKNAASIVSSDTSA